MLRTSLLLLALVAYSAFAASSDSPPRPAGIRFPLLPLPAPAPVPPAPRPPAADVTKLGADQLYVIDSDTAVIVLASPTNLVKMTVDEGPIKIRGRFVDGNGKLETKTFKGKFIYTVEAAGTGRVELIVIPVGATKEADVIRKPLDVDDGKKPIPPPIPKPKPDPAPDPKPKPDPKPAPIKADKLWVIVVEDAAADRTVDTAKALNDPLWGNLRPKHDWRHYLNSSPVAVANGYVDAAKSVGYPAVIILDAKDNSLLKKFKFSSAAEIDTAIKEVSK